MSRALVPTLDDIMTGQLRRPNFIVEIYDIRSTSTASTPTRINDVVLFNVLGTTSLPTIVGPRIFTDDVLFVDMTETAGDYVDSGINSTTISLSVSDQDGSFDPITNPPTVIDPQALGRWLRQGNVIVIREGDDQV